MYVPLHGSAGGVLINLKTGEVIPLPYPQLNPEFRMRSQINTIRDERVQQVAMLLEAFAIVESVSNAGAQAAMDDIVESIRMIAAQETRNREER